jgi:hypothetical protein
MEDINNNFLTKILNDKIYNSYNDNIHNFIDNNNNKNNNYYNNNNNNNTNNENLNNFESNEMDEDDAANLIKLRYKIFQKLLLIVLWQILKIQFFFIFNNFSKENNFISKKIVSSIVEVIIITIVY